MHERLQISVPVGVKMRRKAIAPDGTPVPLCQSDRGRRPTAKFPLKIFSSYFFPTNSNSNLN